MTEDNENQRVSVVRLLGGKHYRAICFLAGIVAPFAFIPLFYNSIGAASLVSSNLHPSTLAKIPVETTKSFTRYISVKFGPSEIDYFDPYKQIFRLDHIFWIITLTSLGLIGISKFLEVAGISFRKTFIRPALIVLTIFSLSAWLMIRSTSSNGWDETFLMTSQVESVLDGHGNSVNLTGPHRFAESSTDVGFIWIASFVAFSTRIQPLPALIVTNALGFALLYMAISFRFKQDLLTAPLSKSLLTLGIVLSPQAIAASSAGFPIVWQTLALFLLFSLSLVPRPSTMLLKHFLIVIFAVFVRPENILPAAVISIGIIIGVIRDNHLGDGNDSGFRSLGSNFRQLSSPYVLIGFWYVIKAIVFGQVLPSAIAGKSVDLTSDYLFAGIGYIERAISEGGMGVILASTFSIVALGQSRRLWAATAAFSSVLPGVIVGGDIFPAYWARYIWPAAIALLAVFVVDGLRSRAKVSDESNSDYREAVINGLLAAVVVMNLSVGADKLPWRNIAQPPDLGRQLIDYRGVVASQDNWTVRPVCLARAGLLLRQVLPENVGIATTELNTLAFFARQPLTDLFGLADPRTAGARFDPLQQGFWGFKRRNPSIIDTDKPGVLYESAALSCRVGSSGYGDGREPLISAQSRGEPALGITEVGQMVNSPSFRYRFGDPSRLINQYVPTHIYTESGTSVVVLLRTEIVNSVVSVANGLGATVTIFDS